MKNTITAVQILQARTDEELRDLGREVREWQQSGKTEGLKLGELAQELIADIHMSEDGIMQVAESLVTQEICRRWLSQKSL